MNREAIIQRMREIDLIDFRDEDEDEHVAELVDKVASIVAMAVAKEAESRKAAQLENADLKERLARSGIEQRRAVAKEREECGWKPIETAPKDGTNVLLVNRKGNQAAGLWMDSLSGEGWYLRGGNHPDTFFNDHHGPTHWMPFPPPPSAIRARGEAA